MSGMPYCFRCDDSHDECQPAIETKGTKLPVWLDKTQWPPGMEFKGGGFTVALDGKYSAEGEAWAKGHGQGHD
jgi:hypothetical protein